nr:Putative uncharacterized protein [Moritella viscosa]SHO15428.1 Putative uncharacterized protein [Moritella viscosa]SHO18136.1 Putative uncharacterized protein [Moritella viscosa]SHO18935.1 Putative uncharacterized protein [Moritella viscosa]
MFKAQLKLQDLGRKTGFLVSNTYDRLLYVTSKPLKQYLT